MDSKDLLALGKTDASPAVFCAGQVFDPLTFAPQVIRFTKKQYLFLNKFRLGTSIESAAADAEMTLEQVDYFLNKKDTKAWLADRAQMDHIKKEWEEPARWWKEGDLVWTGEKTITKSQLKVWEEFGKRVAPTHHETSGGPKIEININPEAVKQAFIRQESLEAEIIKEAGQ